MEESLAAIWTAIKHVFRPKGKGGVNVMFNNKTGMFSISRAETQFHIEKLVVNMAQANADEPMPDTTTRVAFHDIFRKRLVVGTKAGPVTIDLAGRLADQERTVDHTLAAFQKNKMLAPLEDKSGDQEG